MTRRDWLAGRRVPVARVILFICVGITSGCAVPTTGVVPRGQDMFTVTRQGEGFWVTVDSLRVAALQEANAFCANQNKKVNVLHTKDIPAGPLGRWPESEVLFKCE
jgi:hypothetical protein